jgi:toxin YoeB
MSFLLNFSERANSDIEYHKKSGNKALIKKISVLLGELYHTPFEGTGKPEALKYHLSGLWSRRINKEHRIVYEVIDDVVFVHSVKGHY